MFEDLKIKDNVFAKIIKKEIPAKIVYEDSWAMAFYDVAPQAPVHILVVPKKEIVCLYELNLQDNEDANLLVHLFKVVSIVVAKLGIASGYRCSINNGTKGGQEVPHLHVHIKGGW